MEYRINIMLFTIFALLTFGRCQSVGDDVPDPTDESRAWLWYTEYQAQAEMLLTNKTQQQFGYVTNVNRPNWQAQV